MFDTSGRKCCCTFRKWPPDGTHCATAKFADLIFQDAPWCEQKELYFSMFGILSMITMAMWSLRFHPRGPTKKIFNDVKTPKFCTSYFTCFQHISGQLPTENKHQFQNVEDKSNFCLVKSVLCTRFCTSSFLISVDHICFLVGSAGSGISGGGSISWWVCWLVFGLCRGGGGGVFCESDPCLATLRLLSLHIIRYHSQHLRRLGLKQQRKLKRLLSKYLLRPFEIILA